MSSQAQSRHLRKFLNVRNARLGRPLVPDAKSKAVDATTFVMRKVLLDGGGGSAPLRCASTMEPAHCLLVGTTQVPRHGQANLARVCNLRNVRRSQAV